MLSAVKPLRILVDRTSPVPLYHQLAEQFTAAIEDGTLKPGDSFENELSIADRLELSRPTVRRAISELVSRGLLVRRRGVGTTVASQVIHRRDELTSLYDDMQRKGQKPVTSVLGIAYDRRDARAAEMLGVDVDTPLVWIERLRLAGPTPTALMHNWLPPQYADITAADLEKGSLYGWLRQRGAVPVIARQTISARRPSAAERKLLALSAGDPLLAMVRRAYLANGQAVEFGDHCYRFDQYAFDVTVHDR